MDKNEMQKEIDRLQSHDMISSTFEYDSYKFRYIEAAGLAKIIVDGFKTYDVKTMSRCGFETWCVCWTADHREAMKA